MSDAPDEAGHEDQAHAPDERQRMAHEPVVDDAVGGHAPIFLLPRT